MTLGRARWAPLASSSAWDGVRGVSCPLQSPWLPLQRDSQSLWQLQGQGDAGTELGAAHIVSDQEQPVPGGMPLLSMPGSIPAPAEVASPQIGVRNPAECLSQTRCPGLSHLALSAHLQQASPQRGAGEAVFVPTAEPQPLRRGLLLNKFA